MDRVLLINIDSTIPNLALKKIEKYHTDKGDEIIWDMPLMYEQVDKTYVSCIFPENREQCQIFEGKALIGGSGYDLNIKLPPEIEEIKPKINWGFTTRGCIRKCSFCFVPKMEGKVHIVGDIYDIWDGVSKEVFVMDNNILAIPDHFLKICSQLKKEKLKVDFNQGLDHRLLTKELWLELISLKHISEIRFAFDDIAYKNTVIKALELMSANGLTDWKTRWYVYIGEKDTFKTVFERMNILRWYKQGVYVMRDRIVKDNPEFIALASWGNTMGAFKMELQDLFRKSDRMYDYMRYFPKELHIKRDIPEGQKEMDLWNRCLL